MRRLLVNDCLTTIPGTRTFWHDLQEWFGCVFVEGEYSTLVKEADDTLDFFLDDGYAGDEYPQLIIRNATYFGPLKASERVPTISLLQDIAPLDSQMLDVQHQVMRTSRIIVFNSIFTLNKYSVFGTSERRVIPLPVDFSLFEPGNALGLQQALSLPDGCVCWIGAQTPVKGWDTFLGIVRANPDIPFVGVFKDAPPPYAPPNLRMYSRLPHERLVEVIGACRVGLCTSRMESQHLAGIEMGACGLPLVTTPVGAYWKRTDMPGVVVAECGQLTSAVRATLANPGDQQATRAYWQREFDKSVVKAAWEKLVEEVERVGPGTSSPIAPDRGLGAGSGGATEAPQVESTCFGPS